MTWTEDDFAALNARFAPQSPRAILKWAVETFGDGVVMGTGFGASGVVLMDLLSRVRPGATVFYLDTDLLFSETYELHDRLAARFDLNIVRVHSGVSLDEQAEAHGDALWNRDPDRCCFIRKVKPLRAYLADKSAWITAIRRDQSLTRADTEYVEWSTANEVVKINPLADWTEDDIWSYIQLQDLPYNPLHQEGFPSIGCMPCTERVSADTDDLRAGRWATPQRPSVAFTSNLRPHNHEAVPIFLNNLCGSDRPLRLIHTPHAFSNAQRATGAAGPLSPVSTLTFTNKPTK